MNLKGSFTSETDFALVSSGAGLGINGKITALKTNALA
jgi:hypothetical protein